MSPKRRTLLSLVFASIGSVKIIVNYRTCSEKKRKAPPTQKERLRGTGLNISTFKATGLKRETLVLSLFHYFTYGLKIKNACTIFNTVEIQTV